MGEAQELTGEVYGFVERYSSWTGRAWLEIRGTQPRRLPIRAGYGDVRAELRSRHPGRPFTAEWSDGQFPPAPFGGPAYPALVVAWGLAAAAAAAAAVAGGPVAAGVAWVAVSWPLLRLLDAVRMRRSGLRVGPVWASTTPWHEVLEVGVWRRRLWVRTQRGGATAFVPGPLVPAMRARLRRLGALELVERPPGTDQRYAIWREVAPGVPWGILTGSVIAMWWTADPWATLAVGLLVVAGTALLGAVVEARASGWGAGGVGWLTVLHALVVGIMTLGGWLAP